MHNSMDHFREQVYYWVNQIPKGKVTSYGVIAKLAGFPRHARHVSKALGAAPNRKTLPWQRVIGADGKIAFDPDSDHYALQQDLLQKEGINIVKGKIELNKHAWEHPFHNKKQTNKSGIQAEDFFR